MYFPIRWLIPVSGRKLFTIPLQNREKKTFRLHVISSIMGALSVGVLLNHEYIAANGLNATVWQITLLTMIWPVSNLFSVLANHFIDSKGIHFQAIMIVGILFRLPVALMYFSSNVNVMLLLLLFFFASNSVVIPGQNAAIRKKYGDGHRATLFGWSMSVFTLFSLPAAMLVGALLDADFQFYRILFIVEAVFGALQSLFIALMTRGLPGRSEEESGEDGFLTSLWRVFRKDREFARFEAYFMLYGIGFMLVLPVIPFYASDILGLSYEQYAIAKGVIAQLGVLLLAPFMGAKVDRLHPFRFTGIMCVIMGFYPLVMMLGGLMSQFGTALFYMAYAVYAVGMAGILMSWNMSSMYFAPEGQAATYQGLHVTVVAVRGLFAPVLGNIIFLYSGYMDTFLVSSLFFLTAGFLHLRRYRIRCTEGSI